MLGPLPYLHRVLLVVVALAVSTGIGIWLGLVPTVPLSVALGTFAGLAVGAGVAYLLVHDFHLHPQPIRTGRHLR